MKRMKKEYRRVRMFLSAALLLFVLGNACAVALLQFCIQRYMFYAFPLFYILYGNLIYERLKGVI